MRKAILFLLVFNYSLIFAQEYTKLFRKDLTDRIGLETFAKTTADKDLEMASKIHPELLYYYITYYNLKYDGKVEEMYRLYDKELGEARSKYIKERNSWFYLGEEQLKVMEKDSVQLEGELQYLQRNNPYKATKIGQLCDSCLKADKNRLSYFVYKYYMKDSDMMYLPNEDYVSLRREYESKTKSGLGEDFTELKNKNLSLREAEESYNRLISFWYLFSDKNGKESIQAQFTKQIFNNYYHDYNSPEDFKTKPQYNRIIGYLKKIAPSGLSIKLGYNSYFIKSFNYVYVTTFNSSIKIDNKYNLASNNIIAEIALAFRLSEKDKMFSKIFLEGGCGFNLTKWTLFLNYSSEMPPFNGAQSELLYVSSKMTPEKNNLKVTRLFNYSLKVKTPLVFIGHDLSFGIGAVADISKLTYEVNMDFNMQLMWRGLDYFGNVVTHPERYYNITSYGRKESKTLTKFYPILTADYSLPWNFCLICEASLDYYTAGFSYNLF